MKYYLIAGERSGDLHGANLIRSLKAKDQKAEFRCWGGDEMEKAGGDLIVHYREIAVMGFVEILEYFGKLMRYLRFCRKDILQYRPDVLILIDFAGFNLRIARFAFKHNVRVFYYISPKIWAWNTSRALKIKKYVDQVFVILPFEKEFYQQYQVEAHYVGNPVLDAIRNYRQNPDFMEKNRIPDHKPIVALMPGSRVQELVAIIPMMKMVAARFIEYHFVVAAIKSVDKVYYDPIRYQGNVTLVYDQAYDLLAYADAAIVASGTATLETAIFEVPQVVVYKANLISYWIARQVIKVKFISLVNLICGKEVVKELIQQKMNPGMVADELHKLMTDKVYRQNIMKSYHQLLEVLGQENASEKAAGLIYKYLKDGNSK